jgi:hypothetical protein
MMNELEMRRSDSSRIGKSKYSCVLIKVGIEGEYDYEDTAVSADKGNRDFVDQSWLSLFLYPVARAQSRCSQEKHACRFDSGGRQGSCPPSCFCSGGGVWSWSQRKGIV